MKVRTLAPVAFCVQDAQDVSPDSASQERAVLHHCSCGFP